jgi:hypothetical protein
MYMYAQVQWDLPPLSHMRAFKMEGGWGTTRYFIFIASFGISQFHESLHVLSSCYAVYPTTIYALSESLNRNYLATSNFVSCYRLLCWRLCSLHLCHFVQYLRLGTLSCSLYGLKFPSRKEIRTLDMEHKHDTYIHSYSHATQKVSFACTLKLVS